MARRVVQQEQDAQLAQMETELADLRKRQQSLERELRSERQHYRVAREIKKLEAQIGFIPLAAEHSQSETVLLWRPAVHNKQTKEMA